LATEALVLATLAGATSLLVAGACFRLLQPLVPGSMLAFTHLDLNPKVIGIQFGLALFCTLVSGLLPAFRIAGVANTRSIGGRHHERVRGALIVTEVALAIILLTGAALLFQTFRNLNGVNPGFRQEGLITAQIALPRQMEREPALRTRLYQDIVERVRAIPGVQNAAFTSAIPTTWKGGFSSNTPEGRPFQPGLMFAMMRQVTPEYFDVMKIPLREGRLFTPSDHAKGELVAVVNETAARQYWPGENPIGKRLHRGDPQSTNPWITVIGVVGNVRELGLAVDAPPITYYPESQHPTALFSAPAVVVARTAGDPAAYGNAVRAAILAVSPNQPVSEVQTADTILGKETEERRIQATITVAFAAVALFLACLGIYGVLAYAVAQRRQEFGVRLALGASPGQLAGLVMSGGLRLTLTGVLIGLSAAAGLTRFMESLLFQVRPLEPEVFAAVTGVLFVTAMLACWFPARRAQRVEPAQALRCQ
jgi:predicted permease